MGTPGGEGPAAGSLRPGFVRQAPGAETDRPEARREGENPSFPLTLPFSPTIVVGEPRKPTQPTICERFQSIRRKNARNSGVLSHSRRFRLGNQPDRAVRRCSSVGSEHPPRKRAVAGSIPAIGCQIEADSQSRRQCRRTRPTNRPNARTKSTPQTAHQASSTQNGIGAVGSTVIRSLKSPAGVHSGARGRPWTIGVRRRCPPRLRTGSDPPRTRRLIESPTVLAAYPGG